MPRRFSIPEKCIMVHGGNFRTMDSNVQYVERRSVKSERNSNIQRARAIQHGCVPRYSRRNSSITYAVVGELSFPVHSCVAIDRAAARAICRLLSIRHRRLRARSRGNVRGRSGFTRVAPFTRALPDAATGYQLSRCISLDRKCRRIGITLHCTLIKTSFMRIAPGQ